MATKRKRGSVNKFELFKTIFEARYKADLGFYDLLYPAAQKLEEYPHWKTDRFHISLYDAKRRCSVSIGNKSFSFDQDFDDNPDRDIYLKNAVTILPKELNIPAFIRTGLRQKYLFSVKMNFDELNLILKTKLFSAEKGFKKAIPGNITDLNFRVDCKTDDFFINVTVGPVKTEEIEKWLPITKEFHLDSKNIEEDTLSVYKKYPDVAVYFDVDVFREDDELPISQVISFIEMAQDEIKSTVSNFVDFLFSTDIGK